LRQHGALAEAPRVDCSLSHLWLIAHAVPATPSPDLLPSTRRGAAPLRAAARNHPASVRPSPPALRPATPPIPSRGPPIRRCPDRTTALVALHVRGTRSAPVSSAVSARESRTIPLASVTGRRRTGFLVVACVAPIDRCWPVLRPVRIVSAKESARVDRPEWDPRSQARRRGGHGDSGCVAHVRRAGEVSLARPAEHGVFRTDADGRDRPGDHHSHCGPASVRLLRRCHSPNDERSSELFRPV